MERGSAAQAPRAEPTEPYGPMGSTPYTDTITEPSRGGDGRRYGTGGEPMEDKIWANSGDSHFIEPEGLWHEMLPPALADHMPRSERIGEDEEIVHVDGKTIRRRLPKLALKKDAEGRTIGDLVMRPPGARDLALRMKDLDQEGIWAEIVFSSLGLWET